MIILDTDVVSTLMKIHLDKVLAAWLGRQAQDQLVTTSVSIFEISVGIARKPEGKRRRVLETAFRHIVPVTLGNRVLPLDIAAAEAAGRLRAQQLADGRSVSIPDSLIAGVAASRGLILATRNTRDFDGLGLTLINPWL